jgi:hypothetical protein
MPGGPPCSGDKLTGSADAAFVSRVEGLYARIHNVSLATLYGDSARAVNSLNVLLLSACGEATIRDLFVTSGRPRSSIP